MIEYADNLKKHTRLLVRKGTETLAIKRDDIALFYTENKVVFVLDKQEQKYIYNKTLTELEEELDPHEFFRANRQYIIHIDAIKSFKPYERVKLQILLNLTNTFHTLIVSQHTASSFKKWIGQS
ncbi:LytR/AlgR family response regulator transcription factor [Flavihumibacter profundi]|jgi:DNA-binding LytR/AlgR family response regulator|uniref:LytR/AlgR family response regulator transcription factor n=1 Tax=Flavihumibacter profundi TaxID=2716883 RepID=UPI001CC75E12|nr:LytTR family DNA-binding domain-containing protein [Flavihumibacter profundi]MBZ5859405.1 LytTR family transcriptional regulator [Flavihumibacter profundi]